jgi:hypothetical protein
MPVEPSAASARLLAERPHPRREGQKVPLRQFARNVDKALRPLLSGSGISLVLAATEPLASTFRSVNTYTLLVKATIEGSPDAMTEAQLGERARAVLDGIYRDEENPIRGSLQPVQGDHGHCSGGPGPTIGAVDSMLVDIDGVYSRPHR